MHVAQVHTGVRVFAYKCNIYFIQNDHDFVRINENRKEKEKLSNNEK